MIVALVNLKGGAGKTTSALYFATVAKERGEDPVVLDADNERSALEWAASGELPFEVLEAKKDRLARQAEELLKKLPLLDARIRSLTRYEDGFGSKPSYLKEYEQAWKEVTGG